MHDIFEAFLYFFAESFSSCFIASSLFSLNTLKQFYDGYLQKSFSANCCVCVISVLGSIVCLFLVKFIFFYCYDKWPLIKTLKILDIVL